MAARIAHIYGLADPKTQQLRYVGKTLYPQKRLKQHLGAKNHSHLSCWINSLVRRELTPEIFTIEEVDESEWQEAERFWIAYFIYVGADLVNGSHGGLGGSKKGHRFTPEGRARINAATRKACKGKPLSEEHKAKLRAAHLGKKLSAEHRQKIGETLQRRYQDPKEREKLSEAAQGEKNGRWGVTLSDETKAKISAARKGRGHPQTMETREKIRKARLGKPGKSPGKETRAKLSIAAKADWQKRKAVIGLS